MMSSEVENVTTSSEVENVTASSEVENAIYYALMQLFHMHSK